MKCVLKGEENILGRRERKIINRMAWQLTSLSSMRKKFVKVKTRAVLSCVQGSDGKFVGKYHVWGQLILCVGRINIKKGTEQRIRKYRSSH